MKKPILLICSFAVFAMLVSSCTQEDLVKQVDTTTDIVDSASDYTEAENAFEDIFDIVDEEAQQQDDLNGFTSEETAETRGCAQVSLETANSGIFPATLTLDFGDNCTLADGRSIAGSITAVFSGLLREPGTSITYTFSDLNIDGNTISGTQTVTNNGLNAQEQLNFSVVVENGRINYANGTIIEYETNRIRTWVEGQETTFWTDGINGVLDDVWEITGTAKGVNRAGNEYDVEVTNPLRRQLNCRWLTSGTFEVDTESFNETAIIDYGDGTCDDKATVSIGLFQQEITLR